MIDFGKIIRHFRTQALGVELPLVRKHWRRLLLVAVWQYVHKVGTNIVYYLHVPGPLLNDTGFAYTPF